MEPSAASPNVTGTVAATATATAPAPSPGIGNKMLTFHLLFGVMLPIVTFLVEALTGICAEAGFDPLATWWHAGLVLSVPAGNGWLLWLNRERGFNARVAPWADRASAWVAGVAAGYALLFLPLAPFALIAVIFFGLGLLPLAPLFGLLSALLLRRVWRRRMRAMNLRVAGGPWHVLAGVAVLTAVFVPAVVTDWAVHRLAQRDGAPLALAWLRHATSETQLVKNAHQWPRGGLWDWMKPEATSEDYAVAYYRATGRLASAAEPVRVRGLFGNDSDSRRWTWDDALGEQHVGQRVPLLALIESKLEGTADGATATGYTEWTLVFQNRHEFQQAEARALIQLPAGGVVSRLTLWIDGEEREAAFGGRSQVTQAYKAVVSQRRDPVLVTDKGADRVLMQCFPVPPKRGEMKVRLGVTYPLALTAGGGGRASWPRLIGQNFETQKNFAHVLWGATDGAIREHAPELARDPVNPRVVCAQLSPDAFAAGRANFVVACALDAPVYGVVPDGSERRVRQSFALRPGAGDDLAIVLDGSAHMAATGRALAVALARWPAEQRVALWLAGDTVRRAPAQTARGVAEWLREQDFAGGQDDTAALLAAHEEMAGRARAAVLWIHGGQPHTWTNATALVQRFARDGGAVALVDYSTGWSENARLAELAAATPVRRIDPLATGAEEMARVLREVIEPSPVARRELVGTPDAGERAGAGAASVSRQIGRLWAREEVDRLMKGDRPRHAEAVQLAQKSQLVTAVTSAVVLETQAQYDAAGLKPVDPASTPSIPEPATVALIGGALALVFAWRGRRRGARA